MSDSCCGHDSQQTPPAESFRKILWVALFINAGMFLVEILGGWQANSVSLLADAVDFLGDAANYAISLFVLGLAPIWRSRTALLKGITMGVYGLLVLGRTAWQWHMGVIPQADTMGLIGLLALVANVSVALLLYRYREGDANMRSVWLCSRNDAIGNMAVLLAAGAVLYTGAAWPDLLVALLMALLGLAAARQVIAASLQEITTSKTSA